VPKSKPFSRSLYIPLPKKTVKVKILNSEMYFEVTGKGQVIVLLHGFTEDRSIWKYFARELGKQNKVITIDLPGHGESGCLADAHTMPQMAQVVKGVLDNQGTTSAVVIGHSMGGYVALSFAKMFPEMVKGLGLFHSTAAADTDAAKKNRDIAIKAVKENHQGFLFNFIPGLFAQCNRERYFAEIEALVSKANQMDKRGIIAALAGMKERPDMLEFIGQTTYPVMFIAGKQDTRIQLDGVIGQIALPAESYSLVLDNVGHMGYIEAREETLSFVTFFAKQCFRK